MSAEDAASVDYRERPSCCASVPGFPAVQVVRHPLSWKPGYVYVKVFGWPADIAAAGILYGAVADAYYNGQDLAPEIDGSSPGNGMGILAMELKVAGGSSKQPGQFFLSAKVVPPPHGTRSEVAVAFR